MPSLNLCQFIGHVGADPEVRTFDNGNKIATTRIAVSERFTDRNNQPQERTEWIGLVFNAKLADLAEKYIRKGSTIYVSGKWHNREWTDQAGNKRQSTELTAYVTQQAEIARLKEQIKGIEETLKGLDARVLAYMTENNLETLEGGGGVFKVKKSYERATIDTARLKKLQPGIYEQYKKVTTVAASLSFKPNE